MGKGDEGKAWGKGWKKVKKGGQVVELFKPRAGWTFLKSGRVLGVRRVYKSHDGHPIARQVNKS